MLAWSIAAFRAAGIGHLVVTASKPHRGAIARVAHEADPSITIVEGGATRAESVRRAIASIDGNTEDLLLIHDSARPLVTVGEIASVIAALEEHVAVTLAIAATDTIVEARDGVVTGQPSRRGLYRVQTPQGFRYDVIREAHRTAGADADLAPTDDAGLIHRLTDVEVRLVAGSERNIKITAPIDLDLAETLVRRHRG